MEQEEKSIIFDLKWYDVDASSIGTCSSAMKVATISEISWNPCDCCHLDVGKWAEQYDLQTPLFLVSF